jgi:hypothetical protein
MNSISEEDRQWAKAYARQAISDLDVREMLAHSGTEKCHRLHFLQMAAEKMCKAHLVVVNGHDSLKKSHAYIEGTLPLIARQYRTISDQKMPEWEFKAVKRFARQIQLLAPACTDNESRPDNSEYPWQDAQNAIRTPCLYSFPEIDDGPENKTFVRLTRLIRTAAESYANYA